MIGEESSDGEIFTPPDILDAASALTLTMKVVIVLALVALAVARPDGGFYDTKYDNFNAKELAENERLLKAYALCFLGQGKCTAEGTDIKQWIPEAIETTCAKCTEKQKPLVAEVVEALKTKLPEEYAQLTKTYDSDNQHAKDLEQFVTKYRS